ncbi:MAG TPA: glycosyltransferase family 2 protein [bacterium]|nr:glycosyltransferase family 2 protein [bacterium]
MDCSIIIPNYNGQHALAACLEALYLGAGARPVDREVLVVDNGSTDGSTAMVEERYPAVRVVQLPRNTGFTGAIAAGVGAASGGILIFLNNDTRVDFEWQDRLLDPFQDRAIAAVGSLMLDDTEDKIDFAGGTANLFGWGFQVGHGKPAESATAIAGPVPVFFPCGGAMAIRRPVYQELGGFDPDYFAFFEDVDLGWRLHLAGHQAVLQPLSRVAHQQSATAKTMPKALRAYLTERNALATMVKNLSDTNLATLFPWAIGLALERTVLDLGLDRDKLFPGRWGDEVFSRTKRTGGEVLMDEVADLRESSKRIVKDVVLGGGNQSERGQARLLAVEAILAEWPKWMAKRQQVQALRKVGDKQLMPLMQDLLRPPLGHPREQALLDQLAQALASG